MTKKSSILRQLGHHAEALQAAHTEIERWRLSADRPPPGVAQELLVRHERALGKLENLFRNTPGLRVVCSVRHPQAFAIFVKVQENLRQAFRKLFLKKKE